MLLKHAPIEKVTKKPLQSKPWISKDILVFIKEKNKIYHKLCHAKNIFHTVQLHKEFKKLKNAISREQRKTLQTLHTSKKINSVYVNYGMALKRLLV